MSQEQIVQLIFIILPFFLAVVAVPTGKFFIAKLPSEQQSVIESHVGKAVAAAEQLAQDKTASMSSTDKKALAAKFATTLLKNAGITVDPSVIDTLIESAVFMLKQTTTTTLSAPVIVTSPASTQPL